MKVLDKGFVEYVDSMGSDLSVVNAAKVSFNNKSTEVGDKEKKLLKYLADNNHTSPFRHTSVTIHVKAPLYIARQWWKHIIGCEYQFKDTGWNEVSGRYTQTSDVFDYHFPEEWRKQSKSNKQGSDGVFSESSSEGIDNHFHYAMATSVNTYNMLLSKGVAKEQARMVLPQNIYTEWWVTASLQALVHFIRLRNDSHAQLEIQQYAQAVKSIVSEQFPESVKVLLGETND